MVVDEYDRDHGPFFLAAVPREGELLEGEYLKRDGEYFRVKRVEHWKGGDSINAPHIVLNVAKSDEWEESLRDKLERLEGRLAAIFTKRQQDAD